VTVHIPDDENTPTKSPVPIGTDRSGRSCIVAPIFGAIVRVSAEIDTLDKLFQNGGPRPLVIEVDAPDPAMRGIWVREKDLAAVAA